MVVFKIWRIFCAHFYSKRDSIAENIHQQNAELSGATFFVTINVYTRHLFYFAWLSLIVIKLFREVNVQSEAKVK